MVKESIPISFANGLDTKTDPKQVSIGNFVSLENSVFTNAGLLQKRNGFAELVALPNYVFSNVTTFNTSLTAIGTAIAAYSPTTTSWSAKGTLQPLTLSTVALIRNNYSQQSCDTAIAANNVCCVVYLENQNTGSDIGKYAIVDSITQQVLIPPALIPLAAGSTLIGPPRVFVLGTNFVILFAAELSSVKYIYLLPISSLYPFAVGPTFNPGVPFTITDTVNGSFDGQVADNQLYLATALNNAIIPYVINAAFSGTQGTLISLVSTPTLITVSVDTTVSSPVMYAGWQVINSDYYIQGAAWSSTLVPIVNETLLITLGAYPTYGVNLVAAASGGACQYYCEVNNTYSGNGGGPFLNSNYILYTSLTSSGFVSTPLVTVRGVKLASRAFLVGNVVYFLAAYSSAYQSTYFLINGSTSTSAAPIVAMKLAYSNAYQYYGEGTIPSVLVNGNTVSFPYLYQDLIDPVNKTTGAAITSGFYTQTGINFAAVEFGTQDIVTAEIGNDLHISGGFLWMYDGVFPVEHNFFLWPDTDQAHPEDTALWNTTGGAMAAQPDGATNANAYYYQFTYEWTDNAGNAFRSAPSIPIPVTTTGSGTTGSVSLYIPTLRLTYKISSPVKIVIYRWSVEQQEYYQVTSITSPIINDTTVDMVHYIDTLNDSSIVGNNLIYTTGGVVEDVNAPATDIMTLFDTRLWLVDAEDQNLLWFSKQVIESTPVEMSDLFTFYVAPTTGAQGSTGPITALFPMDDKLIIFKNNAMYYINGTGPDNTGANNNYSQPIFITATVGCSNPQSIVFMPQGLMFQSDKGIWLLGRDLSTNYIGAAVEQYNADSVVSAQNIPATNQVRFVLGNGVMLMYDYYYNQWGTFLFNLPYNAVSATLYQNMQTFITTFGTVYQEATGTYTDGATSPVLMQFTTGPLRLGTLQNYQRAYFFYLLGSYQSSHSLSISTSFDYDTAIVNSTTITPTNTRTGSLENWRIFLQQQRCQAFSISVQENYTGTYGAGLTLSGINVIAGFKKSFRPMPASTSSGAS